MSDIIASFEIDKIGPTGPPGPGVVAGGTAGQVLAKIDSTDYNTHWTANNVTGTAGGVLSGTYPNPGFDPGALGTLGAAAASDLNALTTTVQNLTFSNIGGQLVDSQLPPDLALTDPGFDAVAVFTEGTGLITLAKVTESRLSIADNTTGNASTSAHGFQAKGTNSTSTFYRSDNTQAAVTDANLSVSDVTTNNSSTSNHGFLKKLDNTATHYMDGTGNWSTPAGGGGMSDPGDGVAPVFTANGILTFTSKSGIDLTSSTAQTIFTVPAGKNFLVTSATAKITSVTGANTGAITGIQLVESGANKAMTVQANSATFSGGAATSNYVPFTVSTANSNLSVCAAGNNVQIKIGTGQNSTTCVATVYVYGIYVP